MYKELNIENIKIFKNNQKLKIAPITLLYGENSSGKTTLLKTFDIIHNIFFESFVKKGKNVGQKDNPFYRNENIRNISARKIHYYSNQLNKKPIKIEVKIDLPFDLSSEEILANFTGIKKKKVISPNERLPMAGGLVNMEREAEEKKMLVAPVIMNLEIKYYPKEEISRVKKIELKGDDEKTIMKLTREEKKYEKLDSIFDKDQVGYVAPGFNRTLIRPNRYSGAYNRGRPVVESDYFVDDALYSDYKIEIKNKLVWESCYKDYKKIFSKNKKIPERFNQVNTYFELISKFRDLKLDSYNKKKTVQAEFKYFSYYIAKKIFLEKVKTENLTQDKKGNPLKKIFEKSWSEKIRKIYDKDSKDYLNLSFTKIDKSKKLYQIDKEIKNRNKISYNRMREILFLKQLSKSENANNILLNNLFNRKKPISFINFSKFAKNDLEYLFRVRFYKRQDLDIKHELIRENGKESKSTFDYVQIISQYIHGGLDQIFVETSTAFGGDFTLPLFKDTLMDPGLLKIVLKQIRFTVNNYVICHPSKTNVPWSVPNKTDFPKNFLDKTLKDLVKERDSLKDLVKQELFRRKNYLEHFIDPKLIRSDGANFHSAIISERGKNHTINKKFQKKLNKILKEVLNLELVIISPKFLEKIYKDTKTFAAFKIAQQRGFAYPSYPLGMRGSSRTKFIMLRDLKYKKNFYIHGEEVGKGPTNILPFLAQILSDKPNLVYIIQELENNWHPKYQAKIIDLIAKTMLKSKYKNFILETHSELFILQIKKLVQKGILKPSDVSINFISRTKDGNSKITNIPLNDIGGFEKEWPGGFFPERMNILTS